MDEWGSLGESVAAEQQRLQKLKELRDERFNGVWWKAPESPLDIRVNAYGDTPADHVRRRKALAKAMKGCSTR